MAALVLKYCFQKLELWKSSWILNLGRRSNICLEAGNNLWASGSGISITELKETYKIKCSPLHWTQQAIKKNCTLFLVVSISPILLVSVIGEKIQLRMSNLIFVNSSSPPLHRVGSCHSKVSGSPQRAGAHWEKEVLYFCSLLVLKLEQLIGNYTPLSEDLFISL